MLISEDKRFYLPLMEVEFFNDPRNLTWMVYARALFNYSENNINLYTNWLIDNIGFILRLEHCSFETEHDQDMELISIHHSEPYVIPGRTRRYILMTFSCYRDQENWAVLDANLRTEYGRQSLSRFALDPQINPIIESISDSGGNYLGQPSTQETSEIVTYINETVEEKYIKTVNPFTNIDPLAEF